MMFAMVRKWLIRKHIILFSLLSTLWIGSAAVSPAHLHANSPGRSCDVCLVAHLSVWQPLIAIQIQPPARSDWHIPCENAQHDPEPLSTSRLSRAPPA